MNQKVNSDHQQTCSFAFISGENILYTFKFYWYSSNLPELCSKGSCQFILCGKVVIFLHLFM